MKRLVGTLALLLAGCGQAQNMAMKSPEGLSVYDVEPQAKTAGPQIAYTYRLSYTLADAAIPAAQARAVAECRALGPTRCLVLETDLDRDPQTGAQASVGLLVDARLAARFQQRLDAIATDAGGEAGGRHVSAEDVARQIIDTDARVRAKQALADRLLGIIRTANGRVGDLVAAEKAYADVQEELDAARGQRADLARRVAMSRIDVGYTSVRATGTWAPVSRAIGGTAQTFASSIGALVTFVVLALPWAALFALLVWGLRRIGWRPRWPWRRRPTATNTPN